MDFNSNFFFVVMGIFITIAITVSVISYLVRHHRKKCRNKALKDLKIAEEQYKKNLMENYGVNLEINKKGLICPICNIFADVNNVCIKCKRKL